MSPKIFRNIYVNVFINMYKYYKKINSNTGNT